ncbi:MAG: hypothetical protein J5526_06190, partial [Bacteroidales bacterium]|nr:hypothetical protein [Bacteroidales bacterium]
PRPNRGSPSFPPKFTLVLAAVRLRPNHSPPKFPPPFALALTTVRPRSRHRPPMFPPSSLRSRIYSVNASAL